jgi:hypothetical protein
MLHADQEKIINGMDVAERIHSIESSGQYLEEPIIFEIIKK